MSERNELSLICQVKDAWPILTIEQKAMVKAFLGRMRQSDVSVRISKPRKIRSLKANSYLWGVIYSMIAAHLGYSAEDVHAVLKDMFLPRKFVKIGAKEIEIRKTTTDLTPGEFHQYITAISAWASSEIGLTLPDVNQC